MQKSAAREIRIHVGVRSDAALAGGLQMLDGGADAARVPPRRDLEMRHLGTDAESLANLNRLVDGAHQTVRFIANVRDVERVFALQLAAELDELFRVGERAWHVDQAAAHAPGALRQRSGQRLSHARQLGWLRRAIFDAHAEDAQRVVAHQRSHVDRRLRFLEALEILGERLPAPVKVRSDTARQLLELRSVQRVG